jgi:hypothetical protein
MRDADVNGVASRSVHTLALLRIFYNCLMLNANVRRVLTLRNGLRYGFYIL